MRETTAAEHCKAKREKGAGCRNALLFQWMSTPILFVTLTGTLLFSALGSQSAFGQGDGLCLYDLYTSQNKISEEEVVTGYQEHAAAYFGPEEVTGNNQDLLAFDIQEASNEQNSGVFAGDGISLSHELSDEVALSETDWTDTTGEDSGGDLYAANDANTDSSLQASNSKDWEFIIIPYAWLTGIDGDITVRGRTAEVDASFSDLFENLDIAAMLHGEVLWKRKFGFFVDSVYAKLSVDGDIDLPNSTSVDIDDTTKLFLLEFGGLYRAGTWEIGSPYNSFVQRAKPSVTLDLLAGGRYWYMKNELDINGPLGVLPSEVNGSKSWFDFIVGGRVGLDFYKKLTFEVRTDVGGFGLGFSSDISWNIVSVIAYELPWYRITPLIGYRALYVDYSDGSGNNRFENNTWMHGPVIGAAFRF